MRYSNPGIYFGGHTFLGKIRNRVSGWPRNTKSWNMNFIYIQFENQFFLKTLIFECKLPGKIKILSKTWNDPRSITVILHWSVGPETRLKVKFSKNAIFGKSSFLTFPGLHILPKILWTGPKIDGFGWNSVRMELRGSIIYLNVSRGIIPN